MPSVQKQLAASALTNALVSYYTAPASTRTVVNAITVCNTGGSARAVTIKLAGRALVSGRSLAAGETLALTVAHVLEAAQSLQAQQDAGADVDLIASGVEVS